MHIHSTSIAIVTYLASLNYVLEKRNKMIIEIQYLFLFPKHSVSVYIYIFFKLQIDLHPHSIPQISK